MHCQLIAMVLPDFFPVRDSVLSDRTICEIDTCDVLVWLGED